MQKLLLEEVEREPLDETEPFVSRPLLQKDPKEGTWKYVTALQVPKEESDSLKEGREKGNHLPAMDDASLLSQYFVFLLFAECGEMFEAGREIHCNKS